MPKMKGNYGTKTNVRRQMEPERKLLLDKVSAILGKRPQYSDKTKTGRRYKWIYCDVSKIGQVKTACEIYGGFADAYASVGHGFPGMSPQYNQGASGIYVVIKQSR